MESLKSKGIKRIEEKLETVHDDATRVHILQCAKQFKTSWIELGRSLYTVRRDKLFRGWGFSTFEGYCAKEIGIRRATAVKLIHSYMFLEKEEPHCLEPEYRSAESPRQMPDYETVNMLRLAKEKKDIGPSDYSALKHAVFAEGKDHRALKQDLTALIRKREEDDPEEVRLARRTAVVRRFISNLKATHAELRSLKFIPEKLLREAEAVIAKIEECLS